MAAPVLRPAGDRGVLVELDGNEAVHGLCALVRERFAALVVDVVPGQRTVLVTVRRPPIDPRLLEALRSFAGRAEPPSGAQVTIPVRYDGPDLAGVAELTGLDPGEVVRRHRAATYRVAFVGFVPGFAYLVGGDPRLRVPRHAEPRLAVPRGSVALAAGYCGVYPSASPGGWQLIGSTDVTLFDPRRDPPALLAPGATVTFEEAAG
jgi:KipI family sensor histidine kinase inhibitor